jgi:hypothetical protein
MVLSVMGEVMLILISELPVSLLTLLWWQQFKLHRPYGPRGFKPHIPVWTKYKGQCHVMKLKSIPHAALIFEILFNYAMYIDCAYYSINIDINLKNQKPLSLSWSLWSPWFRAQSISTFHLESPLKMPNQSFHEKEAVNALDFHETWF